jgi:hypothetical protein
VRQLQSKIKSFPIAVFLSIFLLSGCEKKYSSVIDSAGSAPLISNATFSLHKIYTDTMYNSQGVKNPQDLLTIQGKVSLRISYRDGANAIAAVHFNLMDNSTALLVQEGELYDNGIFPDLVASDSIFTRSIVYQFGRVFVGSLTLSLWGEDISGGISNTIMLPLEILRRDNSRPVLSNLRMDSIVALGGIDHLLHLEVSANDADGQLDIMRVYFNSFIPPNGVPSSGNPHLLNDDGDVNGISGDVHAFDGIYSLTVKLPRTSIIGTYRFEFHAIDRSFDTSNVIIKNIVITN